MTQLAAVRSLMSDGAWRSLPEIAMSIGAPEASVSARLRDLAKAKYGGSRVERRYAGKGLWKYRVTPS